MSTRIKMNGYPTFLVEFISDHWVKMAGEVYCVSGMSMTEAIEFLKSEIKKG